MRVDGVVLAGGASRRFGSDKRNAMVGGRSLLELACHKMSAAVSGTVFVAGGRGGQVSAGGRVAVVDAVAGAGPLGGIVAGLLCSRADGLLVLACDMPNLRVSTLRSMAALGTASARATAPRGSRGWEPLAAYYPRHTLQLLVAGLRDGVRAPHLWLDRLGALAVRGTSAWELVNVNRPADLARAGLAAAGE
ncbi:MAG: molybdenum cofactor guanylyltransferase [Deltaproteobacteria bacterium]|jgi:molybdopterin-guanine dinucleotide biosynthesis protein A